MMTAALSTNLLGDIQDIPKRKKFQREDILHGNYQRDGFPANRKLYRGGFPANIIH